MTEDRHPGTVAKNDRLAFFRILAKICAFCAAFLLAPPFVPGGFFAAGQDGVPNGQGVIIVYVVSSEGSALTHTFQVTLTRVGFGYTDYYRTTGMNGVAQFGQLALAVYRARATAPGYQDGSAELELTAGRSIATMMIQVDPKPGTGGDTPAAKGMLLAPKAQKEMTEALVALHDGKNEDARKHIAAVYAMAPGNPDVNDVYGEVLLATKEYDKAQEYLQRAISLDPDNAAALSDMGFLRLAQKDYVAGEISAQRAVGIAPQSWFAHYVLGVCELHLNEPQKAADQANLAIKAGKGEAPDAEYLLGESLAVLGQRDDGINVLQQLLKDAPDYANAPAAKAIIAKLQGISAAANGDASSATVPAAETGANAVPPSNNSANNSADNSSNDSVKQTSP